MAGKKTEKKTTKKTAKPATAPKMETVSADDLPKKIIGYFHKLQELTKRVDELELSVKMLHASPDVFSGANEFMDKLKELYNSAGSRLVTLEAATAELASQVATLQSVNVTSAAGAKPSRAAVRAAPGTSYRKLLQEIRAKRNTPPAATEPEK